MIRILIMTLAAAFMVFMMLRVSKYLSSENSNSDEMTSNND